MGRIEATAELFAKAVPVVRNPVPLVLSAKRRNFRHDDPDADEKDSEFEMVKKEVRSRDDFRCRGCGFQSKQGGLYMQVHHLNDDHGDNSPENLAVLCIHCHAPFHCGFWGRVNEAKIVFLPEIEQWMLSHICRLGLVADAFLAKCDDEAARPISGAKTMGNKGISQADLATRARGARTVAENVQALLAEISKREEMARNYLGTSDPSALAEALVKIPEDRFRRRGLLLEPFRLLLKGKHKSEGKDVFPDIARGWLDKTGPFFASDPLTWASFLSNAEK